MACWAPHIQLQSLLSDKSLCGPSNAGCCLNHAWLRQPLIILFCLLTIYTWTMDTMLKALSLSCSRLQTCAAHLAYLSLSVYASGPDCLSNLALEFAKPSFACSWHLYCLLVILLALILPAHDCDHNSKISRIPHCEVGCRPVS